MNLLSQHYTGSEVTEQHPEVFRLPPSGKRDPYFQQSRSFYYEGEKCGYFKLIRLRKKGKLRGITLVNREAVAAYIRLSASETMPEDRSGS